MIRVERASSALHCPLNTVVVYPDLTVSFNGPRSKTFIYQSVSFHFKEFQGKIALFNYWGNCLVYDRMPQYLLQVSPDTTGVLAALTHYMFYNNGKVEVCANGKTVKTILSVDVASLMLLCPQKLQEVIDV